VSFLIRLLSRIRYSTSTYLLSRFANDPHLHATLRTYVRTHSFPRFILPARGHACSVSCIPHPFTCYATLRTHSFPRSYFPREDMLMASHSSSISPLVRYVAPIFQFDTRMLHRYRICSHRHSSVFHDHVRVTLT
jgi:hypothetical protein